MLGLALQPSNGVDMPKPCAVCAHKRRSEIDVELVSEPVNVSAIARQYDVSRKAVTNHRDTHLPGMLRRTVEVFSHAVDMPTVGQIGAEYMRLYLAALDALATAQAGTLIDLDDNGSERRRVSVTAISRAVSEARKTVDAMARLAADAAEENERPTGVANVDLSERVRTQLAALLVRQGVRNDIDTTAEEIPHLPNQISGESSVTTPGGLSVVAPGHAHTQNPLDSATPFSTAQGLTPRTREVVSADEQTRSLDLSSTPLITIPNPRYQGNPAASSEERAAAGYPDVQLTMDDLRSKAHLLVPDTSDGHTSDETPSPSQ